MTETICVGVPYWTEIYKLTWNFTKCERSTEEISLDPRRDAVEWRTVS